MNNAKVLTSALAAGFVSAASAQNYYLPNPAATYLLAGFGFEQIAYEGYATDGDFNVFGSVGNLYSDTTQRGDRRFFADPSEFESRAFLYWDGTNLSSTWDGLNGGSTAGDVGGFASTTTVGEVISTSRRLLITDTLYSVNFDMNGEVLDRAILFVVDSTRRDFSIRLDRTGYEQLTQLRFMGHVADSPSGGPTATLEWFYSLNGSAPLTPVGNASILGITPTAYTVDLSPIPQGPGDVWLVGALQAPVLAGAIFDHIQIIAVPEPSTVAALLGVAGLAVVILRRRRA